MQRPFLSLLGCSLLVLAGCDRQMIQWAILQIGFNAPLEQLAAQHGTADKAAAPRTSPVAQTAECMLELREITGDANRVLVERDRAMQLIERVGELARREATGDEQVALRAAVLREAQLAALDVGVRFGLRAMDQQHQTLRMELLQQAGTGDLPRRAASRFVTKLLSNQGVHPELSEYMLLHAATYPDCSMNSELFISVARQLAADARVAEAVRVAEHGLRNCSDAAEARLLSDELQQMYAEYPASVGVPMHFTGPDLKQRRIDLKEYRGRPVLVVFWASWCPACRDEMSAFGQIAEQFRHRGLQVVGVSLDHRRSELEAFVNEHRITWPQVFAEQPQHAGWANPIARYYGVSSVPFTFLLDGEGRIHARGLRGQPLAEALRQMP